MVGIFPKKVKITVSIINNVNIEKVNFLLHEIFFPCFVNNKMYPNVKITKYPKYIRYVLKRKTTNQVEFVVVL